MTGMVVHLDGQDQTLAFEREGNNFSRADGRVFRVDNTIRASFEGGQ